jgi:hypothetical protein
MGCGISAILKAEAGSVSKQSSQNDEPLSLVLLGEKWPAGGFALRVEVRARLRLRPRLSGGLSLIGLARARLRLRLNLRLRLSRG